jgi:hypothetical protein
MARVSNSLLVDADAELSPLRNLATNQPINSFPLTPRGIANLTDRVVSIMTSKVFN